MRALKARADQELALLEGTTLVEEALQAGLELVEAATGPAFADSARGQRLLADLRARGVPARSFSQDLLDALSEVETSQGVLAVARRPSFREEQLLEGGVPLVLVTVGIQNPGNLGGLLRSAEAAGATGAYVCAGCADPLSWKALRGSMGSAFRLPHLRGLGAAEALARAAARGLVTVAADARGEAVYDRLDLRGPVALVLGAEGSGLPDELRARVAHRVRIPMRGAAESLNVGVAGGILFFEAARQRRGGGP